MGATGLPPGITSGRGRGVPVGSPACDLRGLGILCSGTFRASALALGADHRGFRGRDKVDSVHLPCEVITLSPACAGWGGPDPRRVPVTIPGKEGARAGW